MRIINNLFHKVYIGSTSPTNFYKFMMVEEKHYSHMNSGENKFQNDQLINMSNNLLNVGES
jgi:hypothetical protein